MVRQLPDSPGLPPAGAEGGEGEPTGARVLVVDDDSNVREVLHRYLSRAGFEVIEAADGISGLRAVRTQHPQLVILDLMLPGMDGIDVCTAIRAETLTPVIMLTALGSEDDRVVGLEHGADDYVVKPFSPREVTLRTTRILARSGIPAQAGSPVITDGDLVVNPVARTVERAERPLLLTTREFDLLAFLIKNPDQAFSRTELMQHVWQWSFGDESTVTVHARRLREKIELDPANPLRLLTVWGHGYRYHQREPATAPRASTGAAE